MDKCLCGKEAVSVAFVPIPNVYCGLKQCLEPHMVCSYHAEMAKKNGLEVV